MTPCLRSLSSYSEGEGRREGGTEGRKDWLHSVAGMPGREKMGVSTISNGLENSYLLVMQKLWKVQGHGHCLLEVLRFRDRN